MATKSKKASARKKDSPAVETSETIAEQTRLFLKNGGEIEVIASGVSGQPSLGGNRHITIGNK